MWVRPGLTMRVDRAKNDNDPMRQAEVARLLANMAKAPDVAPGESLVPPVTAGFKIEICCR